MHHQSMDRASTDLVPMNRRLPVRWQPPPHPERWVSSPRKQAQMRRRMGLVGACTGVVYVGCFAGALWVTGRMGGSSQTAEAAVRVSSSSPPSTFAPSPPVTESLRLASGEPWGIVRNVRSVEAQAAALKAGKAVELQGGVRTVLVVPGTIEDLKAGSVFAVGGRSYVAGRAYAVRESDWQTVLAGVRGVVLLSPEGAERRVVEGWATAR